MRAPKNEAIGTSGETEVVGQFESLGWGVLRNVRHDLGSDLFVAPRDADRNEMGVLMGIQVKTGKSWFRSPVRSGGEVTGWWFKSDVAHFDYWLQHSLPHLVILRDQTTGCSYWVHVTNDAVQSTGKGAKIFVPAHQVVDRQHHETLQGIALSQRPKPAWDGSLWTGVPELSPTAAIRHALLTPRLVAPHPNLGPAPISGLDALALQVLLEPRVEWVLAAKSAGKTTNESVGEYDLTLAQAQEANEWPWRAAAAVHRWLFHEEEAGLLELRDASTQNFEYAAALVLETAYYFAEGKPHECIDIVSDGLLHHQFEPVDLAWLKAQKSRALLEVGRRQEAFDLAIEAQGIYRQIPEDVTAATIAGACAAIGFRAAGWMKGDLGSTIRLRDNAASWWRSQLLSNGLAAMLNEQFRAWSNENSIRYGQTDAHDADRKLFAAALLSSLAADHGGWANAVGLRAQHHLIGVGAPGEEDEVAAHLFMLRQSGDGKRTRLAAKRILQIGPLAALKQAATEIDPSRSTVTTVAADLELLSVAGQLLDYSQADEVFDWTLNAFEDPTEFVQRTLPGFDVSSKLLGLLRSIVPALSTEAVRRVADFLLALPPVPDQPQSTDVGRLVRAVPDRVWNSEDRQVAADRSKGDGPGAREAFMAVAEPTVAAIGDEIRRRARDGDLEVLSAISDMSTLSPDVVDALSGVLREQVAETISAASNGRFVGWTRDAGHALAILSFWHPANASWETIEQLLAAPHVSSGDHVGALAVLAKKGGDLPKDVRRRLLAVVLDLHERRSQEGPRNVGFFLAETRCRPAEAAAALGDDAARRALLSELLAGGPAQRVSAAHVVQHLDHTTASLILTALVGESHEAVRLSAINGLSVLLADGADDPLVLKLLLDALDGPGVSPALAAMSGLSGACDEPATRQVVLKASQHMSGLVRQLAAEAGRSD